MSITKGQFRWLVTAWVVVMILGVIVSIAGESSLPAPLRDYVASQSDADLTVREMVIGAVAIPLFIAFVVSIIGLYRFWRFARPLTVILCIASLIFDVFAGPTVDTGLVTSLYELDALLTGIILAVIYITPARVWFEKTHDT